MIGAHRARYDPDVEAAMLAAYGVDVLDPAVTPRRISVLLPRLRPGLWPDADHSASWSTEAHLLAALVDAVQVNTHVFIAANSKRKQRPPKPLPRPGKKERSEGMDKKGLVRALSAALGGGQS